MIDNPTVRARSIFITLFTVLVCALMPDRASAQLPRLTTTLYAPVRGAGAFVQDPSTPSIQYVVSEIGSTVVIRVIQNGRLLTAPFLDLSGAVRDAGPPAQVGLAFPKDYGSSGRFYVSLPNPAGHIVLSRFKRSTIEPLVADASSRFDVRWPGGQPFIPSPCAPCGNDYGAPVVIGADGYLYLATHGVSRGANNPDQPAQNPSSLLGKVLRIDVSVADSDPEGYDIPADNPFVGRPGHLAEIWSFGWRNPRHLSLDDPALGGSGGLTIREVIGFFNTDEINFEPAARGGRNYGWPTREGFSNTAASVPPAFLPLTDPVHAFRASEVSGGVGGGIYRGTALGPAYRGRYFYADWFNGTVTSIALTIDPGTGEASASNLENHSSDLRRVGPSRPSASTRLARCTVSSLSFEGVYRIDLHAGPRPFMHIDLPAPRAVVTQPFAIAGWALDLDDLGAFLGSGTGISTIHVWAYPNPSSGAPPRFVGVPAFGPRSDLSFRFRPLVRILEPGFRPHRVGTTTRPVSVPSIRMGRRDRHVRRRPNSRRHDRPVDATRDRCAAEPVARAAAVPSGRMGCGHQCAIGHGHRHNPRVGVPRRRRCAAVHRRPSAWRRSARCRGAPR